jgi:hypothetical protein
MTRTARTHAERVEKNGPSAAGAKVEKSNAVFGANFFELGTKNFIKPGARSSEYLRAD